MVENIKGGASLFFKIIVIMIMGLFLSISTSVLCVAAFTEVEGYVAYGVKEGEKESKELYTYYNSDGEDTNLKKYEEEGYTITKSAFRSELKGIGKKVYNVGTQTIIIIILLLFIYSQLWKTGNKDFQNVKLGRTKEDKLKGLKIGLIASAPQFLSFLCLIFVPSFKTAFYKLINYQYFIINDSIIKDTELPGELSFIKYLLLFVPFLIIPAATTASYIIGYKDISFSEKLIYKKSELRKG